MNTVRLYVKPMEQYNVSVVSNEIVPEIYSRKSRGGNTFRGHIKVDNLKLSYDEWVGESREVAESKAKEFWDKVYDHIVTNPIEWSVQDIKLEYDVLMHKDGKVTRDTFNKVVPHKVWSRYFDSFTKLKESFS